MEVHAKEGRQDADNLSKKGRRKMDEKKVREAIKTMEIQIAIIQKIPEYLGLKEKTDEQIEERQTAIEALEKQLPKKIYEKQQKYSQACRCPKCKNTMIFKDETGYFCGIRYEFCPSCGQRLDWSE